MALSRCSSSLLAKNRCVEPSNIDVADLEDVMGSIEIYMERSLLVGGAATDPMEGVNHSLDDSSLFKAANGLPPGSKSFSDQYDLEMGFINRGAPINCFRRHRSQLSEDKAKLFLTIETVQKAEEGLEVRRRSLGSPSRKAGPATNSKDGEGQKVKEKKFQKRKKEDKAKFLDWKMPDLR